MSINALTNAALARRPDFEPAGGVPQGLAEIATAAASTPETIPAGSAGGGAGAPLTTGGAGAVGANGPSAFMQTLTTYIPTEVLTLYVSAVAALGHQKDAGGNFLKDAHGHDLGRWVPFWCFLVATPLAVWIAFATKVKTAGKPIPLSPKQWPLWEIIAATIAYTGWKFALPNTPFQQFNWYSTGLAGFLVLLISWGLGGLAPLMQQPLAV